MTKFRPPFATAVLVLASLVMIISAPPARAQQPPEIAALARGLKNDPALIYRHVHDHIAYEPSYGFRKSPMAVIADGRANAFDQARLLFAMLDAAGYSSTLVLGEIDPAPAQFINWMNLDDDAHLARGLLDGAAIPATVIADAGNSISSVTMEHVWVEVLVQGSTYVLDPAFKSHDVTPPMNLAVLAGYDRQTFMTMAMFGATNSTDYVQGIDREGIRAELETMSVNLLNAFRSRNATLADAVGGVSIVPASAELPQSPPCPHTALAQWTSVPDAYSAMISLNIQGIQAQLPLADVYGKRLTVFFDASGLAELRLDASLLGTGSSGFENPLGPDSRIPMAVSVNHPYTNATLADESHTFGLKPEGAYAVFFDSGGAGRGMPDQLRAELNRSLAQGLAQDSEPVLGGTLALTGAAWVAENSEADRLAASLDRKSVV